MVETALTRPLYDNRALRAAGSAYISTTSGQAIGTGLDMPTMGRMLLADSEPLQISTLTDEQRRIVAQDEVARQERVQQLTSLLPDLTDEVEIAAVTNTIRRVTDERRTQLENFAQENVQSGAAESVDALNERYAGMGVTFDYPMSADQAEATVAARRAEMIREAIIAKSPGGVAQGVGMFGAGLVAMATDPLEVASMFIPVVGPAEKAFLISKLGRVGGRIAVGAIEGGVGQAITEPIYYGMSRQLQLDYTMSDSLLNVGLGFAFGGAIGSVAGVMARRAEGAPVGERVRAADVDALAVSEGMTAARLFDAGREINSMQAAVRSVIDVKLMAETAIRQFANDAPVDVGPVSVLNPLRSSTAMPQAPADTVRGGDVVARGGGDQVSAGTTGPIDRPPSTAAMPRLVPDVAEAGASGAQVAPRVATRRPGQKPELSSHEGSWMVTEKSSGRVREFFRGSGDVVDQLAMEPDKYAIETAGEYLGRINQEIKDAGAKPLNAATAAEQLAKEATAPDPEFQKVAARFSQDMPDDIEAEIADYEAMAAQIEGFDADMAEIAKIDEQAVAVSDVVSAAISCLART